MDKENMKNMVVLRDLPSNIVEEAIVILKPNVKICRGEVPFSPEKIENNKGKKIKTVNSKKYIINEAEMLVSNYISKIENNKNKKMKANKKIEDKCKRLKMITVFLGIAFLASVFAR